MRNLVRNLVEPSPAGSAPKPSGTFSGNFSETFSQTFFGTLLAWPGCLRNPVELDVALHQSRPDLFRNLLRNLPRNPVEPDLALRQSLPDCFLVWHSVGTPDLHPGLALAFTSVKAEWNRLCRFPVGLPVASKQIVWAADQTCSKRMAMVHRSRTGKHVGFS